MCLQRHDFLIFEKNKFPGPCITVVLPADTQDRLRGRDPHLPKLALLWSRENAKKKKEAAHIYLEKNWDYSE